MREELLVCGEPFEIEFFVMLDANTAMPINGYAAKIQLRDGKESGPLIKEWVDGDVGVSRIDAAGNVKLIIDPATTEGFRFKIAFIDLLLMNNITIDGIRSDVTQLTLQRGVTRK